MVDHFDDSCTWMQVVVDDVWQQIARLFKRPGPASEVSDSEVITMALVSECRGWDKGTELIRSWRDHTHLFPRISERTRSNRRRRNLMFAISLIHKTVLQMVYLGQDDQCVSDSLPVPVVEFYLVPSSPGDWEAHGARFVKV